MDVEKLEQISCRTHWLIVSGLRSQGSCPMCSFFCHFLFLIEVRSLSMPPLYASFLYYDGHPDCRLTTTKPKPNLTSNDSSGRLDWSWPLLSVSYRDSGDPIHSRQTSARRIPVQLKWVKWQLQTLVTVPTFVTTHTLCLCLDTRVSYGWCLLIQGCFCAV